MTETNKTTVNLESFIDDLYAAGWKATNDAQWEKIKVVFNKYHPMHQLPQTIIEAATAEATLLQDAVKELLEITDAGTDYTGCDSFTMQPLIEALKKIGGK